MAKVLQEVVHQGLGGCDGVFFFEYDWIVKEQVIAGALDSTGTEIKTLIEIDCVGLETKTNKYHLG